MVESASVFRKRAKSVRWTRGVRREVRPMECGRSPSDLLRVIRGRSNGSGETRATALPKPSAALFAQVLLATNLHPCQSIASRLAIARGICARFSALGGRLAISVRGKCAAHGDGEEAGLGRLESIGVGSARRAGRGKIEKAGGSVA